MGLFRTQDSGRITQDSDYSGLGLFRTGIIFRAGTILESDNSGLGLFISGIIQ